MCVLSLFAAITLSYAWFAKNDTVNGGGMSVAIESDANVVGAEYFLADKSEEQSSSTKLKFTEADVARMGAYDILDKRHQLLVKVYLKSDMQTISVTGNTSTNYFLGATDEDNNSKYPLCKASSDDLNEPEEGSTKDGKTYTNVLSSVINFTVFQADELTALTDGNNGYELVSDTLPSGNRIAKFIDSTAATAPKHEIDLIQTAGKPEVTTGDDIEMFDGKECRTLFIMFSYDEEIMEKIFSDNLGNENMYNEVNGKLVDIPFKLDFTISFEKIA